MLPSSPWLELLFPFLDCLAQREPEWWSVYSHAEVMDRYQKRQALYWLKNGQQLEPAKTQPLIVSVKEGGGSEEMPKHIFLSKAPAIWPAERLPDHVWCVASADLLAVDPRTFWIWSSVRMRLLEVYPRIWAAELTLYNLRREYPSSSLDISWRIFLSLLTVTLDDLAAKWVGIPAFQSFLANSAEYWAVEFPTTDQRLEALGTNDPAQWLAEIRGEPDLFSLDFSQQIEWRHFTHFFLRESTQQAVWQTPAISAYLQSMGLAVGGDGSEPAHLKKRLASGANDLSDYLCTLMMDLISIEPDSKNLRLASLCHTANRWGLLSQFQKWVRQEKKMSKRDWQILWESMRSDFGGPEL